MKLHGAFEEETISPSVFIRCAYSARGHATFF